MQQRKKQKLELEKNNFLNSNSKKKKKKKKKKQSSSRSLIECFKFIDSNLSKRTSILIFCYGLNDYKFAILVPTLHYKWLIPRTL